MDFALMKEITITNSYASEPTSWDIALELLSSGKVDVKPLVGDIFPLERWKEAFAKVENKEGYKILMHPSE